MEKERTGNYYFRNLASGKLNIYIDVAFFESMPEQQKGIFSEFCIWSRKTGCWISKRKATKSIYLRARLNEFGFQNKGDMEGMVTDGSVQTV